LFTRTWVLSFKFVRVSCPEKPIPAKNFLAAVPETPEKPIAVNSFVAAGCT
jgi:hypothetical protein